MHLQSSCFIKQGKEQNTHTNKKKKNLSYQEFPRHLGGFLYFLCARASERNPRQLCFDFSSHHTKEQASRWPFLPYTSSCFPYVHCPSPNTHQSLVPVLCFHVVCIPWPLFLPLLIFKISSCSLIVPILLS